MRSLVVPVGAAAPPIALPSPRHGDVRLAWDDGRPTLLVFFRGFWCPHCRRQLAALREATGEIDAVGAAIVAISSQSLAALTAAAEMPFPLLADPAAIAIDRYGVRDPIPEADGPVARPSTFIVDRRGVVRYAYVGAAPDDRPALGAVLLALESLA
ncbi:MAG TPA: peroxiredoxin family protein [Thermomicrobiales bacterium]|nr:peroxiredoxin family protein [Thermomicrobiales bacterium]